MAPTRPPSSAAEAIAAIAAGFMPNLGTTEASITAGAVLPVLSFPFLPSSLSLEDSRIMVLIWPSMINLLFHFLDILTWMDGEPCSHLQFWVAPLTVCSLAVGFAAPDHGDRGRELRRDDFVDGAQLAFVMFLYQLFRLAGGLLFEVDDIMPRNVFCTLAFVAGILVVGSYIHESFIKFTSMVFYRFATRQVPWWFWLPENGAKQDFEPAWSKLLPYFVFLAAPILLIGALRATNADD